MKSLGTSWIAICCALFLGACGAGSPDAATSSASLCPPGEALEIDGQRRLALIVGVGRYQSVGVPNLHGTVNDAQRMYELLTDQSGYNFPRQNVCLLLDEQATTENFSNAFRTTLTARAKPNDIAVVFFAGHGSQVRDSGGDEPDGWDETFLFHDARSGDVNDFRDDEFNVLLRELHQQTRNITVIFDSCNSGTAARSGARYAARFVPPDTGGTENRAVEGDGGAGATTSGLPGLIALTAASDGTSALERDGNGIFTDALLQVLSQASEEPLTYAQLSRQVPPLVSAQSDQIPYFQGMLQRAVFGGRGRTRPQGLDVVGIGPVLELSGPVLPGIGVGAELRIYDGGVSGDDVRDPGKAKAMAAVTDVRGTTLKAQVHAKRTDTDPVSVGDLAVIARPADDFLKLRVRLRLGDSAEDKRRSENLAESILGDADIGALVSLVQSNEDFELSKLEADRLVLRGPQNGVRNTFERDDQVAPSLWRHARQRALLQMQGDGGADFRDNETLQVQLVPAAEQSTCADGRWRQAPPNSDQVVPLCHAWNLKVSVSADAPMPLLVGAAVLSADGAMFGLPRDGRTVRLSPGESYVFAEGETFRGTPPLESRDRVVAFGTQERNPVAWHLLTQSIVEDDASTGGVARDVQRYLQPQLRTLRSADELDTSTWTVSSIGVRVEANSRFLSASPDGPVRPREYTIADFDIRPYLPDNANSALRRLLRIANELANASGSDGIPYKQHDWSLGSDAENLARGIDCSRSIWYAFTRAGLPFNRDDRYLYTGLMTGENSPMHDEFDVCPADQPYQLGDVLVYRSTTRGDGHTVMIVDADKKIAWGSMGWDGNAKDSDYAVSPDVGVEYQRIKYKPDWERWDRGDMTLRACWRYRRFAAENESGIGLPGTDALASSCDSAMCRVSRDAMPLRMGTEDNSNEETIRE
ncbi:MAG: caspase family protein [Gammaproteobacteria bacterium]|nr:caspase family protein [Gammaproteobacteria bacterium]